jgi:hypothetical protein
MESVELKIAYNNLSQFFTQEEQDAEKKQKEDDQTYQVES